MKLFLITLIMLTGGFVCAAQEKISPEDASKYVGRQVIVCSKVFGVKFLDKSKTQPTFINVGAAYPNSPLTIMIEFKNRKDFSPTPEELYTGKDICVTGEIKEFKGRYEIVVAKPGDIVVQ